ncbi:uncharacterized protein LOC136036359 [Artemia franciscana]|uniref:uncharacterized protein LOC136036359 n=1 Tax=Artemia franciscana TaxID=6661 RepID=UPI0032DA8BE5
MILSLLQGCKKYLLSRNCRHLCSSTMAFGMNRYTASLDVQEPVNQIKTFVFFDLETTGLRDPVRITEVCFVAVTRDILMDRIKKFEEVKATNAPSHKLLEVANPRVLSKLSVCMNPLKNIDIKAVEMTGLSNIELEHLSPFDGPTFNAIYQFLNQFERPFCPIAHNGDRFDFPILKGHLNMNEKALVGGALCCDSMTGLRMVTGLNGQNKNIFPVAGTLQQLEIATTAEVSFNNNLEFTKEAVPSSSSKDVPTSPRVTRSKGLQKVQDEQPVPKLERVSTPPKTSFHRKFEEKRLAEAEKTPRTQLAESVCQLHLMKENHEISVSEWNASTDVKEELLLVDTVEKADEFIGRAELLRKANTNLQQSESTISEVDRKACANTTVECTTPKRNRNSVCTYRFVSPKSKIDTAIENPIVNDSAQSIGTETSSRSVTANDTFSNVLIDVKTDGFNFAKKHDNPTAPVGDPLAKEPDQSYKTPKCTTPNGSRVRTFKFDSPKSRKQLHFENSGATNSGTPTKGADSLLKDIKAVETSGSGKLNIAQDTSGTLNCDLNKMTRKRLQDIDSEGNRGAQGFQENHKKPKSSKLCDFYHFYFKDSIPSAHEAESDVMALVAVTIAAGQDFVDWMDKNAADINFDVKGRDSRIVQT